MEQKGKYEEIRSLMLDEIRRQMDMNRELSDEEIGSLIDDTIMERSHETYLGTLTKLSLRQDLFNSIRRLGLLQELVDDREITEIMVNGPDHIFYEKHGQLYTWDAENGAARTATAQTETWGATCQSGVMELGVNVLRVDALDAGASDVEYQEGSFQITTEFGDLYTVRDAMEAAGYKIASADYDKVPSVFVTLENEDDLKNMRTLLDMLEDNDDVQDVYHNWENCDEE